MSFIRNASIKAKLIGASLLAGTALLLLSTVSSVAIKQLDAEFETFSRVEYAAQAHLTALQLQMGQVRSSEKDALLNFDDAEAGRRFKSQWQRSLEALRGELAAVRGGLAPEDQETVIASLADYERLAGDVIQRGVNGQIVTATEANQALTPAKVKLGIAEPLLGKLAVRINTAAESRKARVSAAALTRLWVIVGVALATLALFVPGMWITVLSVTQPLDRAIHVANRIAEGDLATPVHVQGRDEVARLMRSLASMQRNLQDIVSQVREATDSISTASAEISVGSRDLSLRTEQAATHLQQTASGMQQLTAIVQQAEQSASSATAMSADTSAMAHRGGTVVVDVADRMEQISQSSRRIADITGVIDGIAFQTNLLALNAAVEAARAGEQGRGFAVVAAEVRMLAQRSAQAAREIKQLIATSVDQVDSGAERAKLAGGTMHSIIEAVERVSATMSFLNSAAAEQSRDIKHINRALGHLDQMTQQNAALVEQSAAAAESMQEQSSRLEGLVNRFRLQPVALPGLAAR